MSSSKSTAVGRLVGLWRYPVKSMGNEPLSEVDVSWFGLVGDRRWAFVRNDSASNGFPWFTLRQQRQMNHYRPSFVEPENIDRSAVQVCTPFGDVYDLTDPSLGQELSRDGLRVIKQDRGIFDTFPLSLITTQTIAQLGDTVGSPLEVERFRPNFLVEASTDSPYPEDEWVGRVLRMGAMRMRVDKRDGRCVVITIDPESGDRSPQILRTVVDDRDGCLGVYGSTVEPGRVRLHDEVWLEE